ncbi:alpha/beta fold hydrolase [Nocardia brasiliensis]|uniref:alpha/beta fold hydrolase n=1 Tax=Nocardia brasiliensis TaxID=37326 RepID=UPI00366E94D5
MITFVLVHGAWHGPWAWDRVIPLLRAGGVHTLTPNLSANGDHGLHDHAAAVVAALDTVPEEDEVVLVGHSYSGLVVREAADARPDAVDHVILVDGWAGADGVSLLDLGGGPVAAAISTAVETPGGGWQIPAPPPDTFGIVDNDPAVWLTSRLIPQPMRTFTEPTRLTGAIDRIPGTAIYCLPQIYPFARFGEAVGYQTLALDGPHDVMLTDPEALAKMLLTSHSVQDPRNGRSGQW